LEGKSVVLIGLGSMGSSIAIELVKSGVQNFILIDPDILEVHNICRHVCGLPDIGRAKVEAVRERILEKNPRAHVLAIQDSFARNNKNLVEHVSTSSLVIVTTDVDVAKREANMVCVKYKIPGLFAGVYERAFGGEVIRYYPDKTPCYNCTMGLIRTIEEQIPSGTVLVDYTEFDDPNKVVAEPGLSIDIGFVNLLTARIGLETLKGNWVFEGNNPEEPPVFIFWGNREDWIFDGPFDYRPGISTLGPESCDICNPRYFEDLLGMTKEEIHKKIINDPTLPDISKTSGDKNP
jgi:molybdopterin/thiamine biosynthesis adenylyltransferase